MLHDKKEYIENLFQRYLDNKCTPDEIRILLLHFDAGEKEDLLRSLIREQSDVFNDTSHIPDEASKKLLDTVFSKIKNAIAGDNKEKQVQVVPFYRHTWFRICAAAALLLAISTSAFYFLQKNNEKIVAQKENQTHQTNDIPPGTNNAILTLDNGTTIILDSAANGTLVQQGNVKVLKINGQIAYNKTGTGDMKTKPIYNTITTANGNEYQLILADGSKVWLNAASSIRFPTSFAGNERKVEITGEAYFEVTHDASKPFRVEFRGKTGRTGEIEVLGTHFNVNAYDDENAIKATLLEGSVRVREGKESILIVPGEQAMVDNNGNSITVKKNVDITQVVAWKEGLFEFNNTDIQTIMRQVARWYNIEVNFEGKIPSDGFTGKISRNVPLSDFLKVLQLNGVHVKTVGRRVTIAVS
ncbi:MAG: FecR domain-containing protein [Ginsengibacter sp.]